MGSSLDLRSKIDGAEGYSLDLKLSNNELGRLRELVRGHWLAIINRNNPDAGQAAKEICMNDYHLIADSVDHDTIWPQTARMLLQSEVNELRSMEFFGELTKEFGPLLISDELGLGYEEVYWRLVRPNKPSDFGPLHADKWFWDVRNFKIPDHLCRIKIWIALYVESGKNGLRLCPGSHNKDFEYTPVFKHGTWKPEFDENKYDLNIELMPTEAGNAVVFHDELLHGGAINLGNSTRVSLEFTMLTAKKSS